MSKNILKPFLWLAVFVMLVGLACNFGSSPEATPTSPPPTTVPTEPAAPTPEPTEVLPTLPPPPTSEPDTGGGEGDSSAVMPFDLASTKYVHPDDLFEIIPPEDWTITDDSASVSFDAPDQSGYIYLQLTNTAVELDLASFEQFVDAREANFFGTFSDYSLVSRDVNSDDMFITVEKNLSFEGTPQTVFTLYDAKGPGVYALDFWADSDKFEDYFQQYSVIMDSIVVDSSLADTVDPYLWIYTFTGPGDLFSFEVPTAFRYEETTGDSVVVDTFYSPDEHAVIQNITYDDGSVISKSLAGAFATELLRSYYADDIKITDDQVMEDGSERLTWNSQSGNYSGLSFFETRGTTFLMLSVLWDNPYEDYYFEALDYTISTYQAGDSSGLDTGSSGSSTGGTSTGVLYSTEFTGADDNANWSAFTVGENNYRLEYKRDDVMYVQVDAKDTTAYIVYDAQSFPADVRVEAAVETIAGPNRNNISLVCRGSSDGWYEFSMNSGGFWYIWRYDSSGYTELASGGSTAINLQKRPNQLEAECWGDDLTFYINGTKVGSVRDNRFRDGGQVGVSVSTFDIAGAGVEFDWVVISTP